VGIAEGDLGSIINALIAQSLKNGRLMICYILSF